MNNLHPLMAASLRPFAPPLSSLHHADHSMEDGTCGNCSGSGEGQTEHSSCRVCGGSGVQWYPVTDHEAEFKDRVMASDPDHDTLDEMIEMMAHSNIDWQAMRAISASAKAGVKEAIAVVDQMAKEYSKTQGVKS